VNANRRRDTAMPTSAALADYRHAKRAPSRGPVGGREPGTTEDGRAPHRQPHPAGREVNRMRRPSLEELRRQLEEDGGCEAIDGCFVEPDGTCEHGQPSWLLALGLI
jgi:hypothetical protein